MLPKKNHILIICCSLLFVAVGSLGVSYAINTTSDGYQFTSLQTKEILLADTSCRNVTNNATNRFIPTRTMAEWNSFNTVAASQGVNVQGCAAPCPAGYYRSPNNICISGLRGAHGYQTAWNNCLAEGALLLDNGNLRTSIASVCAQSGNCGILGLMMNSKMVWSSGLLGGPFYTFTYVSNNYHMSLCASDGCMAHHSEPPISSYPSSTVSSWGSSNPSDPADGTHYYFCKLEGACNNSVPLGCITGTAQSDNGGVACGATRTWTCGGAGYTTSEQCSFTNTPTACPAGMTLESGTCVTSLLGPSLFATAYNYCNTTFGTTDMGPSGTDTTFPQWRKSVDGQVNYMCNNGSRSCYPSVYPPTTDQNAANSCSPGWTLNQVFADTHSIRGCTGGYTGNAYYRCNTSPTCF